MRDRLRILTYHRVAEVAATPELNPRLISATPELFDAQMRFLSRHFHVVSPEEVLEAAASKRPLPPRAVLITFDDAYRDFRDFAWPIMKRYGLSALLFVPTCFPDRPDRSFWWDRLFRALMYTDRERLPATPLGMIPLDTQEHRMAALRGLQTHVKSLPHEKAMLFVDELCDALGGDDAPATPSVLGWEELRALALDGVALGAHTRTHPLLTRVSRERAFDEMIGSQRDLEREIGTALPIFSYPNGAHDDTTVRILREERFELALTQDCGHNRLRRQDPLRLRRINVTPRNTLPVLRLRLQSWFSTWDRLRTAM